MMDYSLSWKIPTVFLHNQVLLVSVPVSEDVGTTIL